MSPIYKFERRQNLAAAGRVAVIFGGFIFAAVLMLHGVKADIDDEALPDAFAKQTERGRVVADLRRHVTPCRPPKAGETLVARHADGGPLACAYVRGPARLDATL